MKQIICTVADEDAVKVIGSLIKCGADFSVKAVEEPSTNVRHIRRRGEDGRTAAELVLDLITANRSMTIAELAQAISEQGFQASTATPTVSKLVRDGLLVRNGHHIQAAKGQANG